MKYNAFLLAIIAAALSSCMSDKAETLAYEGEQITIRASQEGATETRTTLVDGGTQVCWEPLDEIKVFYNGASGRFATQITENVTVASFSGTLNVIFGGTEGTGISTKTWGLYPYRADAVLDGETMVTTLPASQTGKAGSFAKNTNITVARSNNYGLAFYNVCGGLRFSLTQEGIKKVTFEGNNGETLAGKIKIAFADGIPVVQEVSEAETMLTLTAPGGGTFQTGQWYYLSAVPGTLSGGFKMVFYKETESAKLSSSSSVSFSRGKFGSLTDADEGLIFKETAGEDPNDVIQFADPIAKYACVEKFDTNNDGEVSYAEAAAATSLSGLFTNWTSVTSFDEIKYFKSVTSTENVFTGCPDLTHITIPDNITTLGTFENCTALETVVLPIALTLLPASCFAECNALMNVTLPIGISSIPNDCFSNCSVLSTLDIPSTVTSLGQHAFHNCKQLSDFVLPSSLTTIGNYAFQNCQSITMIDFPASIRYIGRFAFSGCTSLTSITVGGGVVVGSSAFAGCRALCSASFGSGVILDSRVFYDCTALYSVVLPNDMTTIPASCFQKCTSLKTIAWPQACTTIESSAFAGCRFENADYTVELPATVTSIGNTAFGYIHHLIVPSASPVSIASNSFVSGYTFIYVPNNMVEMYKERTQWSNYADRIRSIDNYPIEFSLGGTIGYAVDLGLSVKWASWNVGASAPEEYGAYFAWGETDLNGDYDWDSYKWSNGSSMTLTKYNNSRSYGIVDNKRKLELEDDAANVNWGGTWRMPTNTEIQELCENCTSVWAMENGIYGRRFTSNKEGYTDKSIFIPAAGFRDGTNLGGAGSIGYYWSSMIYTGVPCDAFRLVFDSDKVLWGFCDERYYGRSVRPVCPKD